MGNDDCIISFSSVMYKIFVTCAIIMTYDLHWQKLSYFDTNHKCFLATEPTNSDFLIGCFVVDSRVGELFLQVNVICSRHDLEFRIQHQSLSKLFSIYIGIQFPLIDKLADS